MQVRIKRLNENAVIPHKAHATDAGMDLTAVSCTEENGSIVYRTGLAFEIPEGYVGLIFPRSSIATRGLSLTNAVGVIDAGYRGEVTLKFKKSMAFNNSLAPIYEVGERIGQIIIMPYPDVEFIAVDKLSDSERGNGGYGSSGR